MKTIFLVLCAVLLCLHSNAVPAIDYVALRALYLSTDGDNWTDNTGWPDASTFNANPTMPAGTNLNTWYGISVDANGCVVCIDMDGNPNCIAGYTNGNNLTGAIPTELGFLSELRSLFLSNNQLSGSIPSELGDLTNLIHLYLFNNQLSSCFDNNLFNLCGQLEVSNQVCFTEQCTFGYSGYCAVNSGNNLAGSQLNGGFCSPNRLGACNAYTSCRQSDSIALVALYNSTNGANWTNSWDLNLPMDSWYRVTLNGFGCVTELFLPNNQLSGTIPAQLGNLSNLEGLYLSSNDLVGTIPPQLGSLSKLNSLNLGNNQLTGSIPPQLGDLDLRTLNLSNNQLSGNIPPELANYPVELIPLVNTGTFPSWSMYLNDNQLTGSIPTEFANTVPWEFDVSNNMLSGSIPSFDSPNVSCSGPAELWFEGNLYYNGNDFSFDDIDTYNAPSLYYSVVSPQYHGDEQYHTENAGNILTLGLSSPLPGNNNANVTYQWKLDGVDIPGATSPTYSISNLQPGSIGEYVLCMQDPTRTLYLVRSRPIYVNICIPTLSLTGNVSGVYHAGFDLLSNGTVLSGSTVSFKAGQIITLQPGFEAELQSELSCEIEACGN